MSEIEPYGREPGACVDLELHGRFIRNLASSLLGNRAESADVTQDVMLAALKSSSLEQVPDGAKRAWFGKVAERLAFKRLRSTKARKRRESTYAKSECGVPAPESLLMRSEAVQAIGTAVHSLREPYRSTILLHFYDDRDAQQIAVAMEVSVVTVRSRLQRAKALLRESLSREFDESERSWCTALLPLVMNHLAADPVVGGTLKASSGSVAGVGSAKLFFWGQVMLGWKMKLSLVALGGLLLWGLRSEDQQTSLSKAGQGEPLQERVVAGAYDVHRAADVAKDMTLEFEAPGDSNSRIVVSNPKLVESASSSRPKGGLMGRAVYRGEAIADVSLRLESVRVGRLRDPDTGEHIVGRRASAVERKLLAEQGTYSVIPVYPANAAQDKPLNETFLDNTAFLNVGRMHNGQSIVRNVPSTRTDSEGFFRFDEVPEGAFLLHFIHEELEVGLRTSAYSFGSQASADLGDLELLALASIRGTVAFEHSLTLKGHELGLRGLSETNCVTDAVGGFAMEAVPPGDYLIGVRAGPGVHRSAWNLDYFIRLTPGALRVIKLRVAAEPSCVVSIDVMVNRELFAEGYVSFRNKVGGKGIEVGLDKLGRGVITLPAGIPLQCLAHLDSGTVAMGEELFLAEGEAKASFATETSALKVHVPLALLPKPETCQLDFYTDLPGATDVRFSYYDDQKSTSATLDAYGRAVLRLPALLELEPIIKLQGDGWVHIEGELTLPVGGAALEVDWNPTTERVSYRGLDQTLSKSKNGQKELYAIELRWPAAFGDGFLHAKREINPLTLVTSTQSELKFDFACVPTGLRDFEVVLLQSDGNSWERLSSWQKTLNLGFGETSSFRVGE